MFESRRAPTLEELARLRSNFDGVSGLPHGSLDEAEVGHIAALAELGAAHTVLAKAEPRPGEVGFYTVAELELSWRGGGGSADDQERYRRFVPVASADPAWRPALLFQPSRMTTSGWMLIDGVHRAAALYTARVLSVSSTLQLPVFVLLRRL